MARFVCAHFNRVHIDFVEETMRCIAKLLIGDLNEDKNERAQRTELKTGSERKDKHRVHGRVEAWVDDNGYNENHN